MRQLDEELSASHVGGPPAESWSVGEPELEGLRAALLVPWDFQEKTDRIVDALIPLWMATRGAAFAVEALVSSTRWRRAFHVRVNAPAGWYLGLVPPEAGRSHHPYPCWGGLREALAAAPWSEYTAARDTAALLRTGALPLQVRCALSYAFPTEHAWAMDDAQAVLAEATLPPFFGVLLCTSVTADVRDALAERVASRQLDDGVLTTAAYEHGAAFSPVLRRLAPKLDVLDVVRAAAFLPEPERSAVALELYENSKARRLAREIITDPSALARVEAIEAEQQATASEPDRVLAARVWGRIEAWLSVNAPKLGENLAAGATLADVAALEAKTGRSLPLEVRASFLVHDGATSRRRVAEMPYASTSIPTKAASSARSSSTTTRSVP